MINKEKYKNNIELEIEPSDEIEVNNNIEKVRITPKIDLFIRKKPQFVKHEQCKSRNLCSNNNNKQIADRSVLLNILIEKKNINKIVIYV